MASAVIDRVWRETTADAIEPTLATIWRDVASRAPVARAVMSNLVIVRGCDAAEPVDVFATARADAIDAIVARHPSRVIVIAHEGGCPLTREPIAARVGVVVYGPPQARYAVEHVSVRSSCDEASLPSIVRRLARGDLPTSVWCLDDLSRYPPLRAIVAEARQLIYDSRRWSDVTAAMRGIGEAAQGLDLDLADLNWRRLAPMRSALRHVGRELPLDALRRGDVHVTYARGEAALASLFTGWLRARLGWTRDVRPRVEEGAAGAVVLALRIGESPTPLIAMTNDDVRVTPPTTPPYVAATARETETDAIVAELRSLATDAALRDTLRALASITSAASS